MSSTHRPSQVFPGVMYEVRCKCLSEPKGHTPSCSPPLDCPLSFSPSPSPHQLPLLPPWLWQIADFTEATVESQTPGSPRHHILLVCTLITGHAESRHPPSTSRFLLTPRRPTAHIISMRISETGTRGSRESKMHDDRSLILIVFLCFYQTVPTSVFSLILSLSLRSLRSSISDGGKRAISGENWGNRSRCVGRGGQGGERGWRWKMARRK